MKDALYLAAVVVVFFASGAEVLAAVVA